MKRLTPLQRSFWNAFLASQSIDARPRKAFVEASFAGSREVTDGLIRLYLEGKKTAGSSLVRDFQSAGDPLPKVGDYWIILDSDERPRCLVKTIRTEINQFGRIPESVVRAEGEGDLSVDYWKEVHRSAYLPHLAEWGIDDLNEAEVVTEHFKLVYKAPSGE